MNARALLRIAAVMTALQGVAHTLGGVYGPIEPGKQAIAAAAMKANQFDAMVAPVRSGISISASVFA